MLKTSRLMCFKHLRRLLLHRLEVSYDMLLLIETILLVKIDLHRNRRNIDDTN